MTPEQALPYNELLARFLALEQQVHDLTAQLAQHEAAPYPHVRYDLRAIGHIVLDGLAPLLALLTEAQTEMRRVNP